MSTYKISDVPAAFGTNLPVANLKNILGLLESLEGFGKTATTEGKVYDDGVGVPTVGYGFNLKDKNSLGAVLNGLQNIITLTVNGKSNVISGNVFQVAAKVASLNNQGAPTVNQIVGYFTWLVGKYQKPLVGKTQNPNIGTLQNLLTDALQQFYLGHATQLTARSSIEEPASKVETEVPAASGGDQSIPKGDAAPHKMNRAPFAEPDAQIYKPSDYPSIKVLNPRDELLYVDPRIHRSSEAEASMAAVTTDVPKN